MIAMTNFGRNGRLGNQLFQYAFMRSQAEASGFPLYVPRWIGDSIFNLDDEHIRCISPCAKLTPFLEPYSSCGYNPIQLPDAVDVSGFFQSERMFDRHLIRRVYSFRSAILEKARTLLGSDFDSSGDIAVGIRLADFDTIPTHYCPRPVYYRTALARFDVTRIFLFSDDTKRAETFIRRCGFQGQIVVMAMPPILSLAAMSRFSNFIIGPSTFHWWGAWLSPAPNKRVVAPVEGATRPGAPVQALEFWPLGWENIRALHRLDGYKMRANVYPVIHRLKGILRLKN